MTNEFEYNNPSGKDRLEKRRRRRRKNRIASLIILFGVLIVLTLVIYLIGTLIMWVRSDSGEDTAQVTVSYTEEEFAPENESNFEGDGEIADGAGSENGAGTGDTVMYTQVELDARIAEAVALAREEASVEILEGMKSTLSDGETTVVEMLRPYFQNELVVVSNGKYNFVPIQEELKKNSYVIENLEILESGEQRYVENGQVTSYKGIDVSKFQGKIDWQAVAADGVDFAFIRVGNRGYGSEGKLLEDERFEENIEGARAAGIKVGVYFYTQAVNEQELLEEANFVLQKIAPYTIECPIVYDVEKVSGKGRMNELSVEERTNLTLLFCRTIENAGYKPMIYYNVEMAALMLDLETLEEYDKWLAYYNPDFYFPYDYKIWQYSQNGRVNGIKGDVDMNISFEPIWE